MKCEYCGAEGARVAPYKETGSQGVVFHAYCDDIDRCLKRYQINKGESVQAGSPKGG